jgi:NAD(P)-dependent dehydrogenase (short-subunit alcohol dehydrogenase family)
MSKTILITGAGSGFGEGAAIGMAKNGHNVIATVQVSPQVTPCGRRPRRSASRTSASSGST